MSKKRIIKFENQGCVPCVTVGKILEAKNVEYEAVSPYTSPDLAVKYKVRTVPVVVLVDENGEELKKAVGVDVAGISEIVEAWQQ